MFVAGFVVDWHEDNVRNERKLKTRPYAWHAGKKL